MNYLKKIILILLGIILFTVLIYFTYNYLLVTEIYVNNKNLKGISLLTKKNYFFIDENKIANEIKKLNPEILDLSIKKEFPNKIFISYKENKAIASLPVTGGFFELGKSGVVLKKSSKENASLIKVNFYQKIPFESVEVGSLVDKQDIQFAMYFLDKFKDLKQQVNFIEVYSSNKLSIITAENKEYIFSTVKNNEIQFEELKLVLKKIVTEKINYKGIDLRFDKAVIKLN